MIKYNSFNKYFTIGSACLVFTYVISSYYKLIADESSRRAYYVAFFLCISMYLFSLSMRYLWKKQIDAYSNTIKLLYYAFIVWSAFTIIRSHSLRLVDLRDIWGIPNYGWAYYLPIIMPMGSIIIFWSIIFNIFKYSLPIGLIATIMLFMLFNIPTNLNLLNGSLFLLLFYNFTNIKKSLVKYLLFPSYLLVVISYINILSRTMALIAVMYFICASIIYISYNKSNIINILVFIIMIATINFMLLLITLYGTNTKPSELLNKFNIAEFIEKIPKNSRVNDKHNMYDEFFSSLTFKEIIIGKGVLGEYYGHIGSKTRYSIDRRNVECGYLQIILKGGVVLLILFLSISIVSMYYGFFNSNNLFIKSCALVILMRLIEMFPYGLPTANLYYLIFWMSIGACLSDRLRNYRNDEIIKYLKQ